MPQQHDGAAREEASDAVRPFWASAAVELGALDVIAVLAL